MTVCEIGLISTYIIGKKYEGVRNIRYENKLTIVDLHIFTNVTYVTEALAFNCYYRQWKTHYIVRRAKDDNL